MPNMTTTMWGDTLTTWYTAATSTDPATVSVQINDDTPTAAITGSDASDVIAITESPTGYLMLTLSDPVNIGSFVTYISKDYTETWS